MAFFNENFPVFMARKNALGGQHVHDNFCIVYVDILGKFNKIFMKEAVHENAKEIVMRFESPDMQRCQRQCLFKPDSPSQQIIVAVIFLLVKMFLALGWHSHFQKILSAPITNQVSYANNYFVVEPTGYQ